MAGVGGRAEAELALWADAPLEAWAGDAAGRRATPAAAKPQRRGSSSRRCPEPRDAVRAGAGRLPGGARRLPQRRRRRRRSGARAPRRARAEVRARAAPGRAAPERGRLAPGAAGARSRPPRARADAGARSRRWSARATTCRCSSSTPIARARRWRGSTRSRRPRAGASSSPATRRSSSAAGSARPSRRSAEARRRDPEACPALEAEVHAEARAPRRARRARRWRAARASAAAAPTSSPTCCAPRAISPAPSPSTAASLALDPMREAWRAGLGETLAQSGDDARRRRRTAAPGGALSARVALPARARRRPVRARPGGARAQGASTTGWARRPRARSCTARSWRCATRASGRCPGIMDPLPRRRPRRSSPTSSARRRAQVGHAGGDRPRPHRDARVPHRRAADAHAQHHPRAGQGRASTSWARCRSPTGADVLTLRAVKADGTTREPEEIAEKETVSVPDSSRATTSSSSTSIRRRRPAPSRGGFLAERFFFRSYDAPLYRSEYVVAAPREHDAADRSPRRRRAGGAPSERRRRVCASHLRDQAAAAAVPGAVVDAVRRVPAVGARGAGLSTPAGATICVDQQLLATRANAELARRRRGHQGRRQRRRQGARRRRLGAQAHQGRRRRARRGRHVDPGARGGQPHHARGALLRAAGVLVAAVAGASAARRELDGELPDLEGFDEPLLRAGGHHARPALSPRRHRLRVAAVARRARVRAGAGPLRAGARRRRPTPTIGRWTSTCGSPPTARREVTVREQLRGWPALEWREALEKLAADRVQPGVRAAHARLPLPGRERCWRSRGRARTTTPGHSS